TTIARRRQLPFFCCFDCHRNQRSQRWSLDPCLVVFLIFGELEREEVARNHDAAIWWKYRIRSVNWGKKKKKYS
ncbi:MULTISPECIES: hypothetical protein, partial [unclassified Okeania]|uniref:hypothetical protein n=1 Tax=unclassified Okeania TaxID=2634635 RepID=UPI00257ED486